MEKKDPFMETIRLIDTAFIWVFIAVVLVMFCLGVLVCLYLTYPNL